MMFRIRRKWDKPFSERIAKRVSRIPTNDLTIWLDQAIYELGRLTSTYNREPSKDSAKELLTAAEAVHAVANELNKRITPLM